MLAALATRLVLAYLLPGGILLHQMAVRQSEELTPSFAVTGTVILTGEEARKTAAALGVEVREPLALAAKLDFAPGRCTLNVQGPRPVSVLNERGQVGGEALPWIANLARLGCLPFLFRGEQGSDSLEAALRKAGGNFDETALAFEDGEVSYVLGAGENGTGPTGLAVKKRDLVPSRVWEQHGGARTEVTFGGYRGIFHQGGFPTSLELRVNGIAVARFDAIP